MRRGAFCGRFAPWSAVVALALTPPLVLGCGAVGPGAAGPKRPLPSWAGHQTELFDDAIEPKAVGLDLDRSSIPPGNDRVVRERSEVADAVLRVRVDTVTSNDDGVNPRYDMGLRTVEQLGGTHPPPETFGVRITRDSPSAGLMKSFGARLGGKTFVAFVREYVRPDGDSELHFHIAPDDKDLVAAVRDAVALHEFK